jgi:hypothetical protein
MTYLLVTILALQTSLIVALCGTTIWALKQRGDKAVRAAELEGVAKEQAAETLRAVDTIKHVEGLHRAERERADYLEDELHLAETRAAGTPAAGSGKQQLQAARAQVKRSLNLAAGPGRARAGSGAEPPPLPPLPAAAGKRRAVAGVGDLGTRPGDEH